jgi:hypothetical protein
MTEQLTAPVAPAPRAVRRRSRLSLGPYLVPLTQQDRESGRATVAVNVTFDLPSTGSDLALKAVQARLAQLVRAPVPGALRELAEHLFDGLADPSWLGPGGVPLVEAGFRVTHLVVAVLPRDVADGQPTPPLAVITVEADERA